MPWKGENMATLYKSFAVKADGVSEDGGTITGYASTWDREPDSYGDVVVKGAFAESLAKWGEREARIPFLYGHRTDHPQFNIGWCEAEEDEAGLRFTAHLDAESELAQDVRKLYKEGRIYQFSFAYAVQDAAPVELAGGVFANELRKLDLYEISAVQIPANRHAEVIDVKEGDAHEGAGGKCGDAIKEIAEAVGSKPAEKAGRRNSKADADELRSVLEHVTAIQTIVNGLLRDELADEQEGEGKEDSPEAKSEEPSGVNDEESKALDAKALELLQQANEILEKEVQQ